MDFRLAVAKKVSELTEMDLESVNRLIEIPPQEDMGDFAFPCFALAKTMRKAPNMIASDLSSSDKLSEPWLSMVEAKGPYLNFFVDRGAFAKEVLSEVIEKGTSFGQSEEGSGKTVIIEYSSPNIAKPFHVGHAFTTILGHSLSRIYEKLGYKVVRMNHLGDYGTQFGKLITAFRLWGDEEALEKDAIAELLRIYVKFHEEEKKDENLTTVARENFKKLEDGCEEEVALWTRFRDLSLKEFNKLYDRMGVSFDNYNGESYYSNLIPGIVDMLREKGLLVESEGAQVVMLDEKKLPPCIILKSDGTTIYASRDLAAAKYRYDTYHFDKNIYVVGMPQALHFQQVFAVLEKAGMPFAKNCEHVGFGLVKFQNMKFSTREGNIVTLEDLLNESVAKTYELIKANAEQRNSDLSDDELKAIAEKVGLGAVIYTYVKAGRERDIVFSWDTMLDFEGDTAPYLIYTYARTRSILRKAKEQGFTPAGSGSDLLNMLSGDEEFACVKMIADLPEAIKKAASSNEPFMVSRAVAQIARSFNRFYNNCSILGGDDAELKTARLALCEAVCDAIEAGTYLLGIPVVEQM
ncbi:MAG: arginine--tRNA ligase [Clostridiales bacterium]|nr:arginine--tRNA ligase [Clostridiales bacterium]